MNQAQMLAQVRKMQEQMAKAQEELANTTVTGTAAGDAVAIEMTGEFRVKSVRIKKEAVDPEDVETLEDLVTVAVNDAIAKIQEISGKKMGALTGGLRIPGLM
ncbi:MAG: YbaB/EbfC family nucleoid-associated protein [Candidatus Eremiobacteraeota bacterium]|nr:YbaB/EbfC family nucleoid-associated protein [Candidatus Eremiobacteraeota bacterium]